MPVGGVVVASRGAQAWEAAADENVSVKAAATSRSWDANAEAKPSMKSLLAAAAAAGFTSRLLKNLDSKPEAVKSVDVVLPSLELLELLGLLGLFTSLI